LSNGGKQIELLNSDISDWRITFVETGLHSNLGQRLMAVRRYVEKEDIFLANYSDGLTDLPFNEYLNQCLKKNRVASFLSVRPSQSFHTVSNDEAGNVLAIKPVKESDSWVNGGFFVLKRELFDYMEEGDELVEAPFQRLIEKKQLYTYKYTGFWAAMDTFKDKVTFDSLYARGDTPWELWRYTK
jgi:glucose-1-phosphate cytidylyltransferase